MRSFRRGIGETSSFYARRDGNRKFVRNSAAGIPCVRLYREHRVFRTDTAYVDLPPSTFIHSFSRPSAKGLLRLSSDVLHQLHFSLDSPISLFPFGPRFSFSPIFPLSFPPYFSESLRVPPDPLRVLSTSCTSSLRPPGIHSSEKLKAVANTMFTRITLDTARNRSVGL